MTKRRAVIFCILIICTAVGVGAWLLFGKSDKPLFPKEVTDQVSYIIYAPAADWTIASTSIGYKGGILTFEATRNNIDMTITEQATPDVFNDVPQYFPTLTTRLNEYAKVGTANGQAHLTKPKEFNGDQQAVLNNDGTLFFAHPNKPLSNDDWRRFFNNLQIIKP